MRRWPFFLVLLCACGRFGFGDTHPDGKADDDGSNADDAPERILDGGFGPFAPPQKIAELESAQDDITPSMRADQLEIMFGSLRPPASGAFLIWDATRTATDQPWTNLVQATFSGVTSSSEPALSADGLQLYFRRNSSQLAFTDRASLGDPWDTPTVATELAGMTGFDYIGDLRAVMNDSSDRLFESTRTDRHAAWSPPVLIAELATGDHSYPTASADGLELFFQNKVSGITQLARAVRAAIDQPFGAIEPVDVGFPTLTVGDPELSHDGHTLVFVVKSTDFDIYEMSR